MGGEQGETTTLSASGNLTSLDVLLEFQNQGSENSWPADMAVEIGLPNGECISFGGFDFVSACPSIGNYTVVWPEEWNTNVEHIKPL